MLRLGLILMASLIFVVPAPDLRGDTLAPEDLVPARRALTPLEEALAAGDLATAERRALDAYLVFENVEPAIAATDRSLVQSLEAAYSEVRVRAAAGDRAGAQAALARVHELLDRAAGTEPLGARAAFLNSFGILFREGIEALLVCAALAAACAKRGVASLTRAIGHGALAAIGASVVTAVLVERVIGLAPAGREAIEGVTMLLATAVLFYVSYWLLSKLQVARWMAFLHQKIGRAESRWALFGVAFLAVYREGAETILFYQALAGAGGTVPIAAGFVVAAILLLAVAVAVLRFGVKLPTRPLFAVTGGLLYYLAIVFAGQGIHELQEAGWIGLTPVRGVPEIGWLGLHPTAETLAAQGLLIALAVMAAAVIARRSRRSDRTPVEHMPAPREEAPATAR